MPTMTDEQIRSKLLLKALDEDEFSAESLGSEMAISPSRILKIMLMMKEAGEIDIHVQGPTR